MRLEQRLKALESRMAPNDATIIAFVPVDWSEDECHEQVAAFADQHGITKPFKTWLCPDRTATEVRIEFIDDLGEFFAEIARTSRRIGVSA